MGPDPQRWGPRSRYRAAGYWSAAPRSGGRLHPADDRGADGPDERYRDQRPRSGAVSMGHIGNAIAHRVQRSSRRAQVALTNVVIDEWQQLVT